MANGSLGQMANAPLALVLAQVRFSPYLTIGQRIPHIQDALRKSYPAFRNEQAQSIEIGPTQGPPKVSLEDLWVFTDSDNREGFVIQQNTLVFLATRYRTFPDFSDRHAAVLNSFERLVPDVLVEGLGLRYVDAVVPKDNESPQDYVVAGLRGCEVDPSLGELRSQYLARWKKSDGQLAFRFSTGVQAPFMPPDLKMIHLNKAEVIERAFKAKASIGLMDFDRTVIKRMPFKGSELVTMFSRMHDDVSAIFKRAMSKHAENIWNSKP